MGGRSVRPKHEVGPGDEVVVRVPPPEPTDLRPESMPLSILYQDGDIAVLDKPAGLVVHPGGGHRTGTLVHGLLAAFPDLSGISGEERPGLVHRLDKETSGVILVAKNDRAHVGLSEQFQERTVEKRYVAIVEGEPERETGTIEGSIGRHPKNPIKFAVRPTRGKPARTGYEVLERFRGYAHMALRPETGRTHQIRIHLASIRLPVLCDKLYGRRSQIRLSEIQGKRRPKAEEPLLRRHALHAERLRLRHPTTGASLEFSSPMPEDMGEVLLNLRLYRSP